MDFYNSISEYWKENINIKSVEDEEREQIEKYGFNTNYHTDILYYGYLFDFVSHKAIMNNKSHLLSIHNKNRINLIFIDYSIRIITNKAFINNIPFFTTIIDGVWNQGNVFRSRYYNKDNVEVEGAINIVVKDNDMESILFNKPYVYPYREFDSQSHYIIKEAKIDNLLDALLFYTKKKYTDETLAKHIDNLNNNYDD
jgi:hypothetical protein